MDDDGVGGLGGLGSGGLGGLTIGGLYGNTLGPGSPPADISADMPTAHDVTSVDSSQQPALPPSSRAPPIMTDFDISNTVLQREQVQSLVAVVCVKDDPSLLIRLQTRSAPQLPTFRPSRRGNSGTSHSLTRSASSCERWAWKSTTRPSSGSAGTDESG